MAGARPGEGVGGLVGEGHRRASAGGQASWVSPGGSNHHPTIVFLSLANTPAYLTQSQSFYPQKNRLGCVLLPPGNLRFREGMGCGEVGELRRREGALGLGLGSRRWGGTLRPPGFGAGPPPHPNPGPGAVERSSRRPPSASPRPRGSRGGEGARRAPEHPRGQDRRADLQLQHVGGRQLRPGVELCAAGEAPLCVPSRELRAIALERGGPPASWWGWLGGAGTEGPPRMRERGQRGCVWGSVSSEENTSGLFLDLLRTTACTTLYPVYGSVYPASSLLAPTCNSPILAQSQLPLINPLRLSSGDC